MNSFYVFLLGIITMILYASLFSITTAIDRNTEATAQMFQIPSCELK